MCEVSWHSAAALGCQPYGDKNKRDSDRVGVEERGEVDWEVIKKKNERENKRKRMIKRGER